ncbi:hypothetical protein PV08_10000 [Exophiala spinifera]|uniref:Cytochrome P450 n=1 Tax=Exophiala spinifera TaxID=91928 RepID=A0A0D1ZIP1_9EURO|nr:uncharacterized protein PV08_10000 [Exophiala spinifera]KIW12722.1 hypothetical protein PV08_10000 [Exophiala spinifera]
MFKGKIFTTIMTKFFNAAEDAGVSGSWVGTFPLIYVRDPSIFHQIFVTNADSITRVGPQRNGPFGILHRVAGDIAITADGDDWRRWRRSLLIDFYNHASLRESYEGIFDIAQRYVLRMLDGMTGPDLRKVLREYALDTVWYVAIGVDDASSSSDQLLSPLPRFLNIVGNATHLYWHALRNCLRAKPFREPDAIESKLRHDIDDVIKEFLVKHFESPSEKKLGESRRSFLQKISQESGGTKENPFTDDVLSQARQVYTFGLEGSELILFWAIYQLSQHPELVKRLRKELHGKASSSSNLTYDDICTIPFMDAVVTELLRLHPPVSTTARIVTKPIVIQTKTGEPVVLPQGTQILSSIRLLHYDTQVWGSDASQFCPDRWLGQRRNAMENHCQYLPFLTGPRGCPCSGFVLLQLKVMLAVLLFDSDIILPQCGDLETNYGAIIEPTKDVRYEVK